MRFAHTNIVAKDWRGLAQFYIDVFDCRVKPPERNLSGQWLDQAIGLQNAKLQGVHLVLPGHGENGPTLEIFTYARNAEHDLLSANSMGFSHIAFEVQDVDQTMKIALEKGAAVLGRITEKEVENLGTLKFVYFRDPEGNIVEIQSWR
jgi:predicted enzyme related to lactoylglutathione lyase